MAIGDKISSSRTAGYMRRINALQSEPRVTTTPYDVDATNGGASSPNVLDVDSSGYIWIGGGNSGVFAHVYDPSDLSTVKISSSYPGTDTEFPSGIRILGNDMFCMSDVAGNKKYKYSISGDSWSSELTSADAKFLSNSYPDMVSDGTNMWSQTANHDIDKFDSDGVSLSTVTLDAPKPTPVDSAWAIVHFGFDDDGNILAICRIKDGAGLFPHYVNRYNASGTIQLATFTGSADSIALGVIDPDNHRIAVNIADGYFVTANNDASGGAGTTIEHWTKNGTVISGIDVGTIDIKGIRYYNDQVYVATNDSSTSKLWVFDADGDIVVTKLLFANSAGDTQTTFYRHPNRGVTTGKVSLGTPDGGVAIPSLTSLTGYRPSVFELTDMRTAIEGEAQNRGKLIDSGTTTSTTTNKLVQTGQNFTSTVAINDTVKNLTDSTTTTVSAIDSDTTLSLNADIMESGELFEISTPYIITTSNIRNIFQTSLSLDDWTYSTVATADKILENHYSDIGLILTSLESSEAL